ncbi:hypothetical protein ACOMHN_018899 [Nucella lapillus]
MRTEAVVSTVNVLPTILDWFSVPYPSSRSSPKLTGKSLLPLTANPASTTAYTRAFSSHNLDEVSMYYPMGVVRTPQYRLINYHSPFPVAPTQLPLPLPRGPDSTTTPPSPWPRLNYHSPFPVTRTQLPLPLPRGPDSTTTPPSPWPRLNYHSPFPVALTQLPLPLPPPTIAGSPTFFTIVNNTRHNQPTGWFKSLAQYYFREQWELFDTDYDRFEMENDATDPAHSAVMESLRQELQAWQEATRDPWRCLPSAVLMGDCSCLPAGNREP